MRDGDKAHYMGKGVKNAVDNVNNVIAPALIAKQLNVTEQTLIDNFMLELDGTDNKSKLGKSLHYKFLNSLQLLNSLALKLLNSEQCKNVCKCPMR